MKWITRQDVKVDRVACPWLIKRFIDPQAEFLFVEEKDLVEKANLLGAIPFDAPTIESIKLNHRGPQCTFEAIIEDYAVSDPALARLALIVRAADIKGQESVAAEGIGLRSSAQGFAAMGLSDEDRWRDSFLSMMLCTHTFKDKENEGASRPRPCPYQRRGLSAFARGGIDGRRVGHLPVSSRAIVIHDRFGHRRRLGRLSPGNNHCELCSRSRRPPVVTPGYLRASWHWRIGLGAVSPVGCAFGDGVYRHAERHGHGPIRLFCSRPSHCSGTRCGFQENVEPGLV